jgi:hypothetical protein
MSKISELWAKRIIAGDKTYAEVPAKLKDEVATVLEESGHKELVVDK